MILDPYRYAILSDALRANVITLALAEGADAGTVFDDDIAPNSDLTRVGGTTTSTVVTPPFGSSSILFTGSVANSSLAAYPTADWIGSGAGDTTINALAFCIDAWVYPTSLATRDRCICGDDIDSGSATWNFYFLIFTTGELYFATRNGSAVSAAGLVTTNTWTHVAATNDGAGNLRLFVNGAQVATGTLGSYTKQGTGSFLWGEQNKLLPSYERNFVGNMKCMRVTVGNARWTSAFTPPNSLAEYAA